MARALAAYAPITILDEPTAKLDRENDAIIMRNLFARHRRAPAAPITIIISHNYAHIQEADEILFFEKGFGLLEHGTHDELMLNPESHYRKLFLADQAEERLREILD